MSTASSMVPAGPTAAFRRSITAGGMGLAARMPVTSKILTGQDAGTVRVGLGLLPLRRWSGKPQDRARQRPISHVRSRRRCNWSLFVTHARGSLYVSVSRAISGGTSDAKLATNTDNQLILNSKPTTGEKP